eukprot:TRINITY_DN7586_c0_g1_i5.p4 TRINITY_DN7586_c0_g1~~TRINITY_DN7586_c0_g1_i5.p4  ORF type:complete len:104 (-),score=0.30 TRINITY_DN7586_c0_g1_i5:116-427(-)
MRCCQLTQQPSHNEYNLNRNNQKKKEGEESRNQKRFLSAKDEPYLKEKTNQRKNILKLKIPQAMVQILPGQEKPTIKNNIYVSNNNETKTKRTATYLTLLLYI